MNYHLGISVSTAIAKSWLMLVHMVVISDCKGSSHSHFFCQSDCINILLRTVIGLKIPSGSLIVEDCFRNSRLVINKLSEDTLPSFGNKMVSVGTVASL